MPFVLDTSVSGPWYLPDEDSPYARQVLNRIRIEAPIVPILWSSEMANMLLVAERRRRITASERANATRAILNLPLTFRHVPLPAMLDRVFNLANGQNLTAYDATYLDIAMREGLPLATLDTDLRAAALRMGVELIA